MSQVLACNFTETGRSRLGLVLGIVNWACILTSLGLIGVGTFIKLDIQEYTDLVENYDGDSLPYLLIAVGLASVITNGIGGFSCFILSDPKKRPAFKNLLVGYLITAICVCISVFAGGIMCYVHITHLEKSFEGGLALAFRSYRGDIHLKEEVDKLQMYFKCCGNKKYTDWFKLLWIPAEYKDLHHSLTLSEEAYLHDDVPFSCCDARASRPCIHYKIHENSAHENYDYTNQLTINTQGCQEALMEYFGDDLLVNAGAFVFAVFVLQLIVIVLVRYLQTSIFEALAQDDPEATSKGYLFASGEQPTKDNIAADNVQMDAVIDDDEFDSLPDEQNPLLSRSSLRGRSSHFSQRGSQVVTRGPIPVPRPGASGHTQSRVSMPQSAHMIAEHHSEPDYANYTPESRQSQQPHGYGSSMYDYSAGYRSSRQHIPPAPPMPDHW